MERRIKIYKTPEEIEAFYKNLYQKIDYIVSFEELCKMQKMKLDFKTESDNKKIFSFEYNFSAS